MPRIHKNQLNFTEDELRIIGFVLAHIGGSPINSFRKHADSAYDKLSKHFGNEITGTDWYEEIRERVDNRRTGESSIFFFDFEGGY